MIDAFIAIGICGLAFWMGYSINQGGTCAVAGAYEILHHRRPRILIGLLAASATAALVSTALVWSGTAGAMFAGTVAVTPVLLLGAVVFGCGALVNDACLLGSLSRLGDGELRLLLLPVGLAGGVALTRRGLGEVSASGSSLFSTPGPAAITGVAVWGLVLVLSLAVITRQRGRIKDQGQGLPRGRRWPPPLTMVVLGLTGGPLFVTAPAWTFTDLIRDALPLAMAMTMPDAIAVLAVAATVCGAIASSLRRRAWRVRRITARGAAMTLVGSALMGAGVATIPGGNDGLVLAAIPALSPGGIAAYLVITVTIFLGLWLIRLRVGRGLEDAEGRVG